MREFEIDVAAMKREFQGLALPRRQVNHLREETDLTQQKMDVNIQDRITTQELLRFRLTTMEAKMADREQAKWGSPFELGRHRISTLGTGRPPGHLFVDEGKLG